MFCDVDIDVCICSTCAFLIVKWILMLMEESGVGSEGSRLEAWMKSHKSAVAIT